MIRKLWPGMLALGAAAMFGVMVRAQLPERVATHWNAQGEVNGWSSRIFLLALTPVIGVLTAVIFAIAPRIDPKRRNFPLHAGSYWLITNVILAFIAGMHVMVIGYNLGWKFNFGAVLGVAMGVLFMLLGNFLTRVRPNWILGIRTPWTLSSDRSWRETHRVGGYAFVVAGLATVLTGVIAPKAVPYVMIAGLGVAAILAIVWSYFAWKRDPDATGRDG